MPPDLNNKKRESIALLVTDHVTAMIAYWDKDLICRFANASYMKWFGKKSADMVDKMTMMELLGPLYQKNLPYITAALNGELQTFEREIPLPTGEIRHSLASYIPDIEEGKVKGFFVHVADVHEMKVLEKELVKLNEIITDQNKQLRNFAHVVSHNLRSYSGSLNGLLQLLDIAESENEKVTIIRYLNDLSKGFNNTVNNLTKIVSFQNQQERTRETCNLLQFISDTITLLKLEIAACQAAVRTFIEPELTLVTNPAYLESILLNLLSNAIKYRHPDRLPQIAVHGRETT
jgi:PAS domain S-box-containing protein